MKDILFLTVFLASLLVLCVPLIVSQSMFFPFISGKNFTFRITVEVMLAAWALLALYDARFRPRWSLVLASVGSFLAALFVADTLGVDPLKSFWSNFERMEGWVTLAHFAAYILVCGSVLQVSSIKLFDEWEVNVWRSWLYVSLLVAIVVGINAFAQFFEGSASQGWRVEGTLGNAAYMAVYMLFSMLVTLWLAFTTRHIWWRYTLIAFLAYFGFLLLQTGTRGVLIGLVAGLGASGLYFALCTKRHKRLRMWTVGILGGLVAVVALLLVFQDSSFVKSNRSLARISDVNLSALTVRMDVWGVALEGVKERPVLGWGQGNFNHIFAKYYNPALANQEPWFDRAHNVFLDWLVAGGIVGLLAYLSMFAVLAWYVFLAPFFGRHIDAFTDIERTLIVGISVGYFIQNLVVFDTLVSYIYFALLLAFVHSRVAREIPAFIKPRFSEHMLLTVATPVAVVLLCVVVYSVNVPYMQAGKLLVSGLREQNVALMMEALDKHPAAGEEVMGILFTTAGTKLSSNTVTEEEKRLLVAAVDAEIAAYQAENIIRPTFQYRLLYYYLQTDPQKAATIADYLAEAAPKKIDAVIARGLVAYTMNDIDRAIALWTEAYMLYPKSTDGQVYYAIANLIVGDVAKVAEVLETESAWRQFLSLPFTLKIATEKEQWAIVEKGLELQLQNGVSVQTLVNLAVVQNNQGKKSEAIVTLEKAMSVDPSTGAALLCVIDNIKNNREPNTACQ